MPAAKHTATQRRADNALIKRALRVLEDRLEYPRAILASPAAVRDYLRLSMADLEHEIFVALWLDAQNRLIEREDLFRGTLTQAAVYPREIVKRALAANAAAVIFAHNHPSGMQEPSAADQLLTKTLEQALALVDVRVIDHFIVGGVKSPFSFAEKGML
ncbi:MAG: DNA repair protein RadC [Rhodocyclaceae bacterium]|nr:DNA repair protein RadC [Rhodocyclaceae bacterium]